MRDWDAYVRTHLALPDLVRERESRVVQELAAQLEDAYRDAIARGLSPSEADAHTRAQITDWRSLADSIRSVDRAHARARSIDGQTVFMTRGEHEEAGRSCGSPTWRKTFAMRLADSLRVPGSPRWPPSRSRSASAPRPRCSAWCTVCC
jgi:hypothetical protein